MPEQDVVIRISAKNLTEAGFKKARQQISGLGKGAGAAKKQFGPLSKEVKRLGENFASMNPVAASVSRSFGAFGPAALAAGAAIGALSAGIASTVTAAAAFEKSLVRMETLVGLSTSEMEEMKDAVKGIGVNVGVGPLELSKALFDVTSAGFRGKVALDVLEASAKGSALGLGEVATIADAATSVMNAYGVANIDGSKAVDLLLQTVKLGKLAPEELASSLGSIIPISSQMKISMEEVGAAIATMTTTGASASEAATRLKGIMIAILKPSKQSADVLEDVGLSMDEVKASIDEKGLLATLQELRQQMSDEQMARFAGRADALTGILSLTGDQFLKTTDNLEGMNKALGVVNEGMIRVGETTAQKAAILSASWEVAKTTVGDFFVAIASKSKKLNDSLVKFAGTDKLFGLNRTAMEGATKGIEGLRKTIDTTLPSLADFEQGIQGTTEQSAPMSTAIKDVKEQIKLSSAEIRAQIAAMLAQKETMSGLAKDAGFLGISVKDLSVLIEENGRAFAETVRLQRLLAEGLGVVNFTIQDMSVQIQDLTPVMVDWQGKLVETSDSASLWQEIVGQAFKDTKSDVEVFGVATVGVGDLVMASNRRVEESARRLGIVTREESKKTEEQITKDLDNLVQKYGEYSKEVIEAQKKLDEFRRESSEETTIGLLKDGETLQAGTQRIFLEAGANFKASAVAGVKIAVQAAIAKSLAAAPWPFNLILAAGAAAAGAIVINRIQGLSPGFREGTRRLDYEDFGSSSLRPLHREEAVIPRGRAHLLANEIAASMGGSTRVDLAPLQEELRGLRADFKSLPRAIQRAVRDGVLLAS